MNTGSGIIVGVVFASLVGLGGAFAAAPVKKVLVIGDSLVSREADNWVAQLDAAHESLEMVAKPHPGWATTSFLKPKLEAKAYAGIDPEAELVLLLMGSNDIRIHGHSDETIAAAVANFDKLIPRFRERAPRAEFVLIAPPMIFPKKLTERVREAGFNEQSPRYILRLRDAYRSYAIARGLRFIDLSGAVSEEHCTDGAHMDAAGNAEIATAVWNGLRRTADIDPVVETARTEIERSRSTVWILNRLG